MADTFRVGDWVVEPQLNSISAGGSTTRLEPKIMQVLVCLAEHTGEVVSKERLIQSVWTDTFVSDDVLTRSISELRRVFGDDSKEPRFIQTIPKSGYRLIAPVSFVSAKETAVSQNPEDELNRPNNASWGRRVSPKFLHWPQWLNSRIMVAAFTFVAITAFTSFLLINNKREASASKAMRSIAVLPFKSIGPETGDDYLGLQVADTLITRLSGTKQLIVRPTGSVRKYADPNQDALVAGHELSVDLVLDGSTARIGDRIRVNVRLLRVTDGSALFAQKYDDKFDGVFGIQDSIAAQVAAAMGLKLNSDETRLLRHHYTENSEAYTLYMMGKYFSDKDSMEGYKKAIDYFNRAINVDVKYGLAHSGLADCYFNLAMNGYFTPKQGFLNAKEEALKALEIDSSLADPHHTLGAIKMVVEYDWAGAETEYKRSIELDPASWPYHSRAKVLWFQGRHDEAMAQVTRSTELDPTDISANESMGVAFFWARRYDEAIKQFKRMLEMDPNNGGTHGNLGITYRLKQMYQEAIAEIKRGNDLLGDDDPTGISYLAEAYAAAGNRDEAKKALTHLKEQSTHRYVDPYDIARIYIGLGEKDLAFEELEKGYEDRSFGMVKLKVDPLLDPIRTDARFKNLLARVGLTN